LDTSTFIIDKPDHKPQMALPAGTVAPNFRLNFTPEAMLSLEELKGHPVVLVFYPADWSAVCGDQITLYNQLLPTFREYGATLLGISVDSVWSHLAFSKDRNLTFRLLADFEPKGAVAKTYGVYNQSLGVCERALFVIDGSGVVVWSYVSPMAINPGADGILEALDKLVSK
jgi:peroxiredoxin